MVWWGGRSGWGQLRCRALLLDPAGAPLKRFTVDQIAGETDPQEIAGRMADLRVLEHVADRGQHKQDLWVVRRT